MILQVLLFAFLAILVGLGLCFLGYAMFRVIFPIWGFLIGFMLGADLMASVTGTGFLATSVEVIIGILFGLIFGALAYYFYSFAVVLFGATVGYALGAGFMRLIGLDGGFLVWFVGLITSVLFAVMFIRLEMSKVFLMVLTSFAGASAMIAGVLALFGQVPPSQMGLAFAQAYIHSSWFWWLIWFMVGFLGTAVQYQLSQASKSLVPEEYSYEEAVKESKKASK